MEGEHPYYDRVIPFHTNSRGWRDREYPLEATVSTQRIVVLGDAFTWGYRVPDREVYPEVLESLMEKTDVITPGSARLRHRSGTPIFQTSRVALPPRYGNPRLLLGQYL